MIVKRVFLDCWSQKSSYLNTSSCALVNYIMGICHSDTINQEKRIGISVNITIISNPHRFLCLAVIRSILSAVVHGRGLIISKGESSLWDKNKDDKCETLSLF